MADELESVRKALRDLSKALKTLPDDPAPAQVHKLRTSSRRVEAVAAAFQLDDGKKSRRLLKSIESIRKAAGSVRDMDVLSTNARRLARTSSGDSLTRLLDHLKSARAQHAIHLVREADENRKDLREHLKEYSKLVRSALAPSQSAPELPSRSHESLHASAMNVVRALGQWPALDAGNIHAFRLKVKELRYTLQLDADADPALVDTLSNVQRRIGDWHDWHQLLTIAREVLDSEADAALLARIDKTEKRKFDRALTAANSLRGKYLSAPPPYGA